MTIVGKRMLEDDGHGFGVSISQRSSSNDNHLDLSARTITTTYKHANDNDDSDEFFGTPVLGASQPPNHPDNHDDLVGASTPRSSLPHSR